jgi:ketosteroid isomerase-like protein
MSLDDAGRIEVTRRGYRAFDRRDAEAMAELMHPEAEVHAVTGIVAHQSEPYVGRRGLEEYVRDVERVWDELKLQPQDFTPLAGERVLVSGRVVIKRGPTRLDVPTAWLWEFDGDLVRVVRILSDPQSIERLRGERSGPDPGA